MSRLEKALSQVPGVIPTAEWEVEILRSVLSRQLGTPDQRNALIRIIEQNKVRRPILPRLCQNLGEQAPGRSTYQNVRTPEQETNGITF